MNQLQSKIFIGASVGLMVLGTGSIISGLAVRNKTNNDVFIGLESGGSGSIALGATMLYFGRLFMKSLDPKPDFSTPFVNSVNPELERRSVVSRGSDNIERRFVL